MQVRLILCVCSLGLILLAACPFLAASDTAQRLKERAETLWNARVTEDWATEFRLIAREEVREATEEQFVAFRKERGPLRFLSAEVGDAAVADDLGWVEVKYTTRPSAYPQVQPRNVQIWDVWQVRDGAWYPLPPGQRPLVPHLPPQRRPAHEEAVLSQRVQAFWEARALHDVALLYQFLEPGYKQRISSEQFAQTREPVSYLSHRVEWAEVIGENGRVKVAYSFKPDTSALANQASTQDLSIPKQGFVIEAWIKADGQWHRRSR